MKDKAKDIAYLRKVYSPLVGQKMIIPEKVLGLCDDYEKSYKSYHGLAIVEGKRRNDRQVKEM